jgi:hypothetical protein
MIRSITYVTLTSANTNYAISTESNRGKVTVINDDGAAASNGNTVRVHLGTAATALASPADLTDKMAIPLNGIKVFENQVPKHLIARCTTALQVLTVIIED